MTNWEHGKFLDYPSKNCLDTVTKLDTVVSRSHQANQWLHDIEQVDQLLNALGKHKPKWSKALVYYYTHSGSVRQQANQCGMAKSTFYERLQNGRYWIGRKLRRRR